MRQGWFEYEQNILKLNQQCETKLKQIVQECTPLLLAQHHNQLENISLSTDFDTVQRCITAEILNQNEKRVVNAELKAFVQMRSPRSVRRGKVSFSDIPSVKPLLLEKLLQVKANPYSTPVMNQQPVYPTLLEPGDEGG